MEGIKEILLKTPLEQIDKAFIEDHFAAYYDRETKQNKPAPYNVTDLFELSNDEYPYVKEGKIKTSAGQLLMNRYVLEAPGIIQELGYWNIPLDADGLNDLVTAVNNLCVNDKITTKQIGEFVDARDRLGFWTTGFLSVSISSALIRPMENVNKRKDELFEQYKDDINSDNPVRQTIAVNKIEKELVGIVKQNLKNDPGYDMYRSGDGNLNNNYKTINVMRGSVFNNATKRYDVVKSSLMDGITKHDITPFANSVLAAAYPSAVGTAEAGYMSKIILSLLQSEQLDPNPNSDCGTQATIPLTITKKNAKYVLFRYINDGGKKVLTDLSNIKNYIDKTVQLYSPQCCKNKLICGKCAGKVFHNLGVTNVGLLVTQITDKLLNLKLKSKHDLSQSAGIIDEKYIFLTPNKLYSIQDGYLVNKATMKCFIPRVLEEINGFVRETTTIECMGIFPVKFYDNNGNELLSTMMVIPSQMNFNIYNDIQEDPDNYIVTYDPDSRVCSLGIQQTFKNAEFFINQVYLYSKNPQIPYNLLTEMMFRCLEINKTDLTGPSITYELLARRVCRKGDNSFAIAYGTDPSIDPLSYEKVRYRDAVQQSGVLQAILFEDINTGLNKGLAATLNGKKPTYTPLEDVIKA